MIKLKIQKNQNKFNLFILSKRGKEVKTPTKVGINKQYNYSVVNYFLIIILQKYGFSISKGLRKVVLTNLLKSN